MGDLQYLFVRYPRFSTQLHDAARFRARSTSHTVAVRDGCTNIPLAAGRAQEDENHSRKRRFRPWPASVRRPGSVRTNPVLGITGLARGLSSCGLHHSTFDDDVIGDVVEHEGAPLLARLLQKVRNVWPLHESIVRRRAPEIGGHLSRRQTLGLLDPRD